jgi:hypothetical protein
VGPADGSGAPDVAGVIALPPLIFLGFLAAVLKAVVPFPLLAAHAFPRYLAGAALAAGGFVMIAMGTRRFLAAGTNILPTLPTTALVVVGIYRRTRNPLYLGTTLVYLGLRSAARRRGSERVETREGYELEKVASCRSLDHRWRPKLDFSSGESFDDHPKSLGRLRRRIRTDGQAQRRVGARGCQSRPGCGAGRFFARTSGRSRYARARD